MSTENNFNQQLIEKIKEKHLEPLPRWRFLLKNYVVWFLGVLSLLFGALTFAMVIYMFVYNDWDMHRQLSGSFAEFVLQTMPYFWLLSLAVFILVVNYNIKHTKSGYRYTVSQVFLFSLIASVGLGGVFFAAGMGQAIDDVLGKGMPYYHQIVNRRVLEWNRPQDGRLAGMIIAKISDENFTLADIERRQWEISAGGADVMPMAIIEVGNPARLIGKLIDADSFQASEILPAMGPGRMFLGRNLGGFDQMPRPMPMHGGGAMCAGGGLYASFEKYPQFRDYFIQSLLDNKEEVRSIIVSDPEFLKQLELLRIDPGQFE